MSDIGWAVKALKNGEKVRRQEWRLMAEAYDRVGTTRWDHLYIENRPGFTATLMVRHGDGESSHFGMIDHHLFADDWEIA